MAVMMMMEREEVGRRPADPQRRSRGLEVALWAWDPRETDQLERAAPKEKGRRARAKEENGT